MRVLSLSTLYPSAVAPNFGRFVELSLNAADATGEVEIIRISPKGLPPWPLSKLLSAYRRRSALQQEDAWNGKAVLRPHFTLFPRMAPARNAAAIAKAVLPLARRLHAQQPFDLVDAQFFWPDGPAAMRIAEALGSSFFDQGARRGYSLLDDSCRMPRADCRGSAKVHRIAGRLRRYQRRYRCTGRRCDQDTGPSYRH